MSFQKNKPLRSDALRKSARGEPCTVRIPGVCDGGGETTVLAHINHIGSMGGKSSDLSACYSCARCHDVIDVRDLKAWNANKEHLDWHKCRAMVETHARMVEQGLISVKGAK